MRTTMAGTFPAPARRLAAVVLLAAVAPPLVAQITVVVPCDRDNSLYESASGSFSNGRGDSVFCGVTAQGRVRRTLLHFDVAAALPANAIVVAAEMHLHVIFSTAGAATEVAAHRVLQTWGEGTSFATAGGGGMGAPSTAGDATWAHAIYPNVSWPAGGDFAPTPSFVFSMANLGSVSASASVADVQDWLRNPGANHGWLLKTAEASLLDRSRRIDSRESAGPRPALQIVYLLPGTTGSWGTGCPHGSGTMATQWVGVPTSGAPLQLVHGAAPAMSLGASFFAFELVSSGFELSPGCRVHLPVASGLVFGDLFATDGAGAASSTFLLPAGYPGRLLVAQALVLDGRVPELVLGNAALLVTQ